MKRQYVSYAQILESRFREVSEGIAGRCGNAGDRLLKPGRESLRMQLADKELWQLFRKIKAVTNNTPNMLIRSMRLNRAAQLLKESRLTVSEITYAVGFSDLKHFREVFQEQFGVLPGEYAGRDA